MEYKVNFVVGEAQSRPGYIELNATHIADLNKTLDDGECTEIIALDVLDFLPLAQRGNFLNHLMQKLEIGAIMKVGGREINAVANAVGSGQINEETANACIYQGRQSMTTAVKTRDLMKFIGLEITAAYNNGFNYIVEARRVV